MRRYDKLSPGPTVVQENGYVHSNGKVLVLSCPPRRRVFVETGEMRPPKKGEWFEVWGAYYEAKLDGIYAYHIWREETSTDTETACS
jgi:hypothetical protein